MLKIIQDTIEDLPKTYEVFIKGPEDISTAVNTLIGQIYYNSGIYVRDNSIKVWYLYYEDENLSVTLALEELQDGIKKDAF